MASVIDIDERAGAFEPLTIRLRGEEYVLGARAKDLIGLASVAQKYPAEEGESDLQYAMRLIHPVLIALCPGLGAVLGERELTSGEELALMPIVTEVIKRVGAIRFRADEE